MELKQVLSQVSKIIFAPQDKNVFEKIENFFFIPQFNSILMTLQTDKLSANRQVKTFNSLCLVNKYLGIPDKNFSIIINSKWHSLKLSTDFNDTSYRLYHILGRY